MLVCGGCGVLAALMAQSIGFRPFISKPREHLALAEPSSVLLNPDYLSFESGEGEEALP